MSVGCTNLVWYDDVNVKLLLFIPLVVKNPMTSAVPLLCQVVSIILILVIMKSIKFLGDTGQGQGRNCSQRNLKTVE